MSEQAARQRLAEAGLINDGGLWLLPDEERLLRQINKLDRLGREVRNVEKRVEEMIESNESRRRELLQTEQRLKQLQAASDDPRQSAEQKAAWQRQRDVLKVRLSQLRELYLPPDEFAAHHQVRHEVIRWINTRNELGLLTRLMPEARFDLQSRYERLARQPAVTAALTALGEPHRLGSNRNYERMLGKLGEYEQLAFAGAVPLYISDGRTRVSVLVNEQAVATCTWEEASGPSLLPESLLLRAGVSLPADAAVEELNYRGRQVRGRMTTVPYLRLGNRVAGEVSVLALPPEFEDIGCVLRAGSISNFLGKPNPAQVRLDFAR